MPETRTWDGACYDRISGPMEALGLAVLARLQLRGDETVLDAGCGSGRITQALIERLPRGRVVAVDASQSMVDAARARLQGADVRRLDLLELDLPALGLERPLDAILSTATFHWILDHEALFERLRGVLRPGGRLLAQCGGAGNIDVLRGHAKDVLAREPYAAAYVGFRSPWNYATPQDTRERLLGTGFRDADCWLQAAPKQPDEPREFLSTIVLGPHYQHLPQELREPFMDDVLAELGEPVVVDYVRLNIDATA
ncbi:MAG TPA: methyltransferase domain-containing protein [Solirubrobacteraceae bacterium]|nr:methyltransferase domain-containing protein [Solirubrobacteraceae bacterium]